MTATLAPFGFRPVRKIGSAPNSTGINVYSGGAAVASAIFTGDLVKLVAGDVTLAGTGALKLGVAAGFKWVDPTTKRPTWASYIPASTSSADSKVRVYVCDDPNQTFIIQAGASVTAGDIGLNFDVTGHGVGDTITGRSSAKLLATSRTTAIASMDARVVGLWDVPGNAFGDAYTIVEVKLLNHLHAGTSV